MKKDLTETKALQIITSAGGRADGKLIIVEEGLTGLKACGALDYLVNKCGYKSSFRTLIKKDSKDSKIKR